MVGISPLFGFLPLGMFLWSCDGIDPLYGDTNRDGVHLVDAKVGESIRIVCVLNSEIKTCSSKNSSFMVDDIFAPAQLDARWKNNRVIEVFLFGGDVKKCEPVSQNGTYAVVLRRISREAGRGHLWSDEDYAKFEGIEDSCGKYEN